MKRIMVSILALIAMFTMTGCSNRYPSVVIDTKVLESVVRIDIGSRYEYVDYDVIQTDSGRDVIIHFDLREG